MDGKYIASLLKSMFELSDKRAKEVIKQKSSELTFNELMAAIYHQGVVDVVESISSKNTD